MLRLKLWLFLFFLIGLSFSIITCTNESIPHSAETLIQQLPNKKYAHLSADTLEILSLVATQSIDKTEQFFEQEGTIEYSQYTLRYFQADYHAVLQSIDESEIVDGNTAYTAWEIRLPETFSCIYLKVKPIIGRLWYQDYMALHRALERFLVIKDAKITAPDKRVIMQVLQAIARATDTTVQTWVEYCVLNIFRYDNSPYVSVDLWGIHTPKHIGDFPPGAYILYNLESDEILTSKRYIF